MESDSPNWKTLKPGDKIHIVQIPSLFDEPHYHNGDWEDIFVLYRNLISTKTVLAISEIDEDGRPWVECESQGSDGSIIGNSLAVDDDSWVREN